MAQFPPLRFSRSCMRAASSKMPASMIRPMLTWFVAAGENLGRMSAAGERVGRIDYATRHDPERHRKIHLHRSEASDTASPRSAPSSRQLQLVPRKDGLSSLLPDLLTVGSRDRPASHTGNSKSSSCRPASLIHSRRNSTNCGWRGISLASPFRRTVTLSPSPSGRTTSLTRRARASRGNRAC